METEVGKLKKGKQLQHKFELLNYMQLNYTYQFEIHFQFIWQVD